MWNYSWKIKIVKNHCEIQARTILVCALYLIKYGTYNLYPKIVNVANHLINDANAQKTKWRHKTDLEGVAASPPHKTFFTSLTLTHNKLECFCRDIFFQASLILASKAAAYKSRVHRGVLLLVLSSALITNIRLAWKNTLAYLCRSINGE